MSRRLPWTRFPPQRSRTLRLELKSKYTIIMVTHNMQQAVRISDKTAFFLLGRSRRVSESPINCFPCRRIKEQKTILQEGLVDYEKSI